MAIKPQMADKFGVALNEISYITCMNFIWDLECAM